MMRLMRLGFAVVFLLAAISGREPTAWFAFAFFGVQALFNIGCCGVGTCQAGTRMTPAPHLKEPVIYEEIR